MGALKMLIQQSDVETIMSRIEYTVPLEEAMRIHPRAAEPDGFAFGIKAQFPGSPALCCLHYDKLRNGGTIQIPAQFIKKKKPEKLVNLRREQDSSAHSSQPIPAGSARRGGKSRATSSRAPSKQKSPKTGTGLARDECEYCGRFRAPIATS